MEWVISGAPIVWSSWLRSKIQWRFWLVGRPQNWGLIIDGGLNPSQRNMRNVMKCLMKCLNMWRCWRSLDIRFWHNPRNHWVLLQLGQYHRVWEVTLVIDIHHKCHGIAMTHKLRLPTKKDIQGLWWLNFDGGCFLNTKHIQRICTLLGRKCWSIPSPKCQRSFSEQPGFFQFSLHGYAKDAGAGSQGSIARGCFFASWKPWAIHSKTYFAYEKYAPFNHSHVELPEGMFEDSIPPTKTTLRGRQLTLSWKTLWLSWSKCFWDMVHVHTFAKIHQIHGIYIYYIYIW